MHYMIIPYKPSSEHAHQLIRRLFSNQEYKFNCVKVAIVNENIPVIERRKESGSAEREGFFSNEQEAVEWVCK